jgi:hypothetical protein
MKVIRHQRPGVTGGAGFFQDSGKTGDESVPIGIIHEDFPALDTATDDVMKGTRSVETGFSRHVFK